MNNKDIKSMKISYRKNWDKNGTCYTQNIKITPTIFNIYNIEVNKIFNKIKSKKILSSEDLKYKMYLQKLNKKDKNYLTITSLDFLKYIICTKIYKPCEKCKNISKIKLDRNTIVELEKEI